MQYNVGYKICYTYDLPVTTDNTKEIVDEADNLFERILKNGDLEKYETEAIRYIIKIEEV